MSSLVPDEYATSMVVVAICGVKYFVGFSDFDTGGALIVLGIIAEEVTPVAISGCADLFWR
jgi:hypothetical protein